MGAEVLLYGYGVVCLSMLVFNVLYGLHLRSDDRRMDAKTEVIRRRVTEQLEWLQEKPSGPAQTIQASHLAWMRRHLSRINYLLAFDGLLDELDDQSEVYQSYLKQMQPVFLYLATVYWKRENTQAAYFCYFLARHKLRRHMELDQIQQVVLSYLKRDSLYCKINAWKALCSFGSPSILVEALQELGVYPRVQFTEPTDTILTISRDDAENGIYYTFAYNFKFQINEGDPATTEVLSIEGEGQPYFIDDWTGEVTKAGEFEIRDGRTYVEVSLLPGEAVLMAIDMEETPAAHAISTTADEAYIEDGVGMIRATASGEYETVLDNGETVTTTIEVPEAISLPIWDITIEDWNEGDKVVNTEEKFGHTTTEVYYTTKKTELSFPQSELVAWKDLPATEEQLATLTTASGDAPSMAQVSGIGTYTTTFTLPEGWTDANGAYLQIGSTNGSIVQVFVNGEKAPGVDTRTLRTDISDLLVEGENTIEVKLATTLTNRMIERDYQNNDSRWTEEFPTVQDYGMTGEVSIVPYTVAQVF